DYYCQSADDNYDPLF
nr:immunoglobulin light chain junction region [Macaca mulatta]